MSFFVIFGEHVRAQAAHSLAYCRKHNGEGHMSATITAAALGQCITYLEGLLQDNSPADSRTWQICCRGLNTIMQNWEAYTRRCVSSARFLQCFCANIYRLREYALAGKDAAARQGPGELDDIVFALTEEMAVLMREYILRSGYECASLAEQGVFEFFETSGRWFLGDGTLVSEYYYVVLPTRIMSELVERAEKAVLR